MFSDLELSRRLERAEGYAGLRFAEARLRLFPDCGAAWNHVAGAMAVFDGPESPLTQTFGLGLFEECTEEALETIESFFFLRGAPVHHEVSPLAGVATLDLLCRRGYRPIEISSVLYKAVEKPDSKGNPRLRVRVTGPDEAALWGEISARGWAHEMPELREFLEQMGIVCAARHQSPCFLAELDGVPGAAGALCLHEGVALFGGASTLPEMRRQGLQSALLEARMHYAFEQGCDVALMVAAAGSGSQRNAERLGFRVAYTRMKWRLEPPG